MWKNSKTVYHGTTEIAINRLFCAGPRATAFPVRFGHEKRAGRCPTAEIQLFAATCIVSFFLL